MDKKLHRLETFAARGSDGRVYSVHGYEHLARVDAITGAPEQWEPTGEAEYKLADGRHLQMQQDGSLRLPDAGITLQRQ